MDTFEKQLNALLVDTFNSILKYEEQSIRSLTAAGVTVAEVHLLEAVSFYDNPPTIGELANRLKVAMPSVTTAVKRLEQKGLVVKETCQSDGRRALIRLTPLGQRIGRAHDYFHRRMVRSISKDFTPEEKTVLLSGMTRLREFFAKKMEDPA